MSTVPVVGADLWLLIAKMKTMPHDMRGLFVMIQKQVVTQQSSRRIRMCTVSDSAFVLLTTTGMFLIYLIYCLDKRHTSRMCIKLHLDGWAALIGLPESDAQGEDKAYFCDTVLGQRQCL